jgi:hypothetical protein
VNSLLSPGPLGGIVGPYLIVLERSILMALLQSEEILERAAFVEAGLEIIGVGFS